MHMMNAEFQRDSAFLLYFFSPPGFQGVEGLSSGFVQISIRFLAHDSGMLNVVCLLLLSLFCFFRLDGDWVD